MNNKKNKAFTLVELLVVITILSIISVIAYQNFGWAVDKAVSGRKISDVSTIETALQQYKADKNYYPPTDEYSSTNLWGYNSWATAQVSNTIRVVYDDQEIESIDEIDTKWWWTVFWSWTLNQMWFKWTISQKTLWKRYLTKDLYDPELWDIIEKDTNTKFIEKWVWRYIYATYKKWTLNKRAIDYNIAYTIKKQESDKYITKISWSYDNESCYEDADKCPSTLIWPGITTISLEDWDTQSSTTTTDVNQNIPYPVTDFTE
jgi:prepilin-type N-terminal cleavage/methylation domain-containing protein